jgi:hypothetical protein
MEKAWIFKVSGNTYIKNMNIQDLEQMNIFLTNAKRENDFIVLDNTLVNVKFIEQVCLADLVINGTIKL